MENDVLLEDAIKIARQNGSIRSALLQLELKIGYMRANRLMKNIEEMGYLKGNKGEYFYDREFIEIPNA